MGEGGSTNIVDTDTACDLAGGVKVGNGIPVSVEDLHMLVDLQAAGGSGYTVIDLSGIEGCGNLLIELRPAKFVLYITANGGVIVVDGLLQSDGIQVKGFSQRFQRIILLNKAGVVVKSNLIRCLSYTKSVIHQVICHKI